MKLDQTDLQILQCLYKDGRKPYTEIAKQFGISEGKVRFRINRMLENDVFEFIIHSNPDKIGLPVQALIGINTKYGKRDYVAKQLMAFQEIRAVGAFIGNHDLIAQAYFSSNEALAVFIDQNMSKVAEITQTDVFLQLRNYKDSFSYTDLIPEDFTR